MVLRSYRRTNRCAGSDASTGAHGPMSQYALSAALQQLHRSGMATVATASPQGTASIARTAQEPSTRRARAQGDACMSQLHGAHRVGQKRDIAPLARLALLHLQRGVTPVLPRHDAAMEPPQRPRYTASMHHRTRQPVEGARYNIKDRALPPRHRRPKGRMAHHRLPRLQ